jgi:hypothetical protein
VGANVTLFSHIGGTVSIGGTVNSLSYQSCIDPANVLRSVGSFGVACPAGAMASGLSAPDVRTQGSFSNDKTATFASVSGPYALIEAYVITLAPGAEINFSASTQVTATTPEPSTAFLFLGTGLIGLGAVGKRLGRK